MPEEKITFEIVQELGTLSEGKSWNKELNIVKWGDNPAKFDIRSWNKDHTRTGKGITLDAEEIRKLKEILNMFE